MDLISRNGAGFTGRHPAIPSTQHAEKPGPTFIHDFATDRKRILFRGHTPPQVHIHEMDPSLQQFLPQLRKDKADQPIALGLHIPKGGGYKHSNCSPSSAHT
jgi:hypothetical protein